MNFLRIFDWHVLLIAAISVGATYWAIDNDVRADLPSSLIAVAIVFPIVFSINAAYTRREEALRYLATIKATIVTLYFAHRDWIPDGEPHAARANRIGRGLYDAVRETVSTDRELRPQAAKKVGHFFSEMSRSIEKLRAAGLAATEVSRVNNYLNFAIAEFERLHAIAAYRTPASLRAYSKVYLNVFPVLYAPLYAEIAYHAGAAFGYGTAISFAFVLVGLDNIQDTLEDPFDGIGTDDIDLDSETDLHWMPPADD